MVILTFHLLKIMEEPVCDSQHAVSNFLGDTIHISIGSLSDSELSLSLFPSLCLFLSLSFSLFLFYQHTPTL